jgi:hypothetical protein
VITMQKRIHVFAMLVSGEGRAPSDETVAAIKELLARNGQRVKEAVSHSHEKQLGENELHEVH